MVPVADAYGCDSAIWIPAVITGNRQTARVSVAESA